MAEEKNTPLQDWLDSKKTWAATVGWFIVDSIIKLGITVYQECQEAKEAWEKQRKALGDKPPAAYHVNNETFPGPNGAFFQTRLQKESRSTPFKHSR